jgi:hypothetical protein
MSAEVPKVYRRVSLGDAAIAGDRPPAQAVVVIADPVAFLAPRRPGTKVAGGPNVEPDDPSIAFEALSRFEYV